MLPERGQAAYAWRVDKRLNKAMVLHGGMKSWTGSRAETGAVIVGGWPSSFQRSLCIYGQSLSVINLNCNIFSCMLDGNMTLKVKIAAPTSYVLINNWRGGGGGCMRCIILRTPKPR